MSSNIITLRLSAANLGPDADAAFFDDWAAYVEEHINERCGFPVVVQPADFSGRHAIGEDSISGADDGQEAVIVEAVAALWEEGCADNFGLPIADIGDYLRERRISASAFWQEAMGGDMAPLPREDVVRVANIVARRMSRGRAR